jgi:glycine/D-amino acid oxidase-like deaminating enzyme
VTSQTAEVVICGAGLAGISAGYYLVVHEGISDVILVDNNPPLTLTSDKSTECYRNWWPGPGDTMVRFMNHSIDLLEKLATESGNYFGLNRRGYIFLTANRDQADLYQRTAEEISALGAGPIRVHEPGRSSYKPSPPEGYGDMPTGADIVLGSDLIREHYPFLSHDVLGLLHTRRCGWLSAQQLGMFMLDRMKDRGARFLSGRVTGVDTQGGQITSVDVMTDGKSERIQTRVFVNAAGPLVEEVAGMIGVSLPVFNELHGKIAFIDTQKVLPRDVPLMIWSDPVRLPWSAEEQLELASDVETSWMLDEFPGGVHFRPEGLGLSQVLLILWTYDVEVREPVFPPVFDLAYPEIVLRGLSRMAPGLSTYFNRMGRTSVDGGYYCKTQENRPLIGPLPVHGAYLIGALSGFGVMACQAAGELLAAHVTGSTLPDYAHSFLLERYDDPAYQDLLAELDASSGQL